MKKNKKINDMFLEYNEIPELLQPIKIPKGMKLIGKCKDCRFYIKETNNSYADCSKHSEIIFHFIKIMNHLKGCWYWKARGK